MLNLLNEELADLERIVIDGHLLKHDTADKIAVDYAHKVGAVEGFSRAIQMIIEIKDQEIEDERV